MYFQIHFGANYETGTYGWTVNLDTVKRSVEWQMDALDKPGVLTVLPGIRGKADLQRILGFCRAGEEEKDYSVIGTFTLQDVVIVITAVRSMWIRRQG